MKFQLDKKKVILRPMFVVLAVMLFDRLMSSMDLSFLIVFSTSMGICLTYSTLKNQSEVYRLTQDALVFEKADIEIPLTAIKEIVRKHAPLLHYSGVTGEGIGYQYFVEYEGYEYELMTACKNKDGKSVSEVLHKHYQKNYRDEKGLKLIVKTKKEDPHGK